MFGYVTADFSQLTEEETARYRGCYCGLCRRIGRVCSQRARLTLTYDMAFLVLVLNSVYGGEECAGDWRCVRHPMRPHPAWYSPWTDYGAMMNTALSYYKCMDDWQDDRTLSALLAALFLRSGLKRAQRRYPKPCAAIQRELAELSRLEQAGVCDPDRAAASFGRLMGALFAVREDEYAPHLYALGSWLGQYIYLLDARLDLREDLERERYNPLVGLPNGDMEPILTMLMAEAAAELEKLPLNKDRRIIENIVFSGVWVKYCAWKKRREDERNE